MAVAATQTKLKLGTFNVFIKPSKKIDLTCLKTSTYVLNCIKIHVKQIAPYNFKAIKNKCGAISYPMKELMVTTVKSESATNHQ